MANILIYNINEPYVFQGGMERVTDTLIRLLQKRGHKVSVLCLYKNRKGADFSSPCDIYYLPLDIQKRSEFYVSLVNNLAPDIVIDQAEGDIIGRFGIFASRKTMPSHQTKYIAVQHNSVYSALTYYREIKKRMYGGGWMSTILSWVYNNTLLPIMQRRAFMIQRRLFYDLQRNYDMIVTLSQGAVQDFHKLCPSTPREKVVCIPNCTHYDVEPEECYTKRKRVLYVGRMENFSKGVDKLLRVWSRVESVMDGWDLHLIGAGQDLEYNINLASRLRIKRCVFHGECNPLPYYQEASIICLTSHYEGFGMVILEAMQYGCVPIAFGTYPAIYDLIKHQENGFIVPPFNEQAYAETIMNLMRNKELREGMAKRCVRHSLKFAPDEFSNQWHDLILKMMQ